MGVTSNLDTQVEILKSLGHRSRTLLNGITGPVEIIRSLSDEPRLVEPLRILELGVSRFDKFSFRALLLSDLLKSNKRTYSKVLDLADVIRYLILDLTDLLDFYNIKINLTDDASPNKITSDYDLINHCVMILLEHIISLSNEGSNISTDINKYNNKIECTFACTDNGFVYKSLSPIFSATEYPSDLELHLLKLGLEMLKVEHKFTLSDSNQTTIKLIFI